MYKRHFFFGTCPERSVWSFLRWKCQHIQVLMFALYLINKENVSPSPEMEREYICYGICAVSCVFFKNIFKGLLVKSLHGHIIFFRENSVKKLSCGKSPVENESKNNNNLKDAPIILFIIFRKKGNFLTWPEKYAAHCALYWLLAHLLYKFSRDCLNATAQFPIVG